MHDKTVDRQPLVLIPEHSFEEKWSLAVKRYKRTIRTFAHSCAHQIPGYDVPDVEQELMVVLWKCVKNYDPERGASFNTLFQGSARNQCISLIRHGSTKSRSGTNVSLDEEAVALAVDEAINEYSSEDRFFMREELRETVSEYGAEALLQGLRGRPRKRLSA